MCIRINGDINDVAEMYLDNELRSINIFMVMCIGIVLKNFWEAQWPARKLAHKRPFMQIFSGKKSIAAADSMVVM